jgi:hypothetical protein
VVSNVFRIMRILSHAATSVADLLAGAIVGGIGGLLLGSLVGLRDVTIRERESPETVDRGQTYSLTALLS